MEFREHDNKKALILQVTYS